MCRFRGAGTGVSAGLGGTGEGVRAGFGVQAQV